MYIYAYMYACVCICIYVKLKRVFTRAILNEAVVESFLLVGHGFVT